MLRCLSIVTSLMPYLRHSRKRIATSCRARLRDINMQMWLVAGFTLNSRVNQFCFTSMCRMPLLDRESRQVAAEFFFKVFVVAAVAVVACELRVGSGSSAFW